MIKKYKDNDDKDGLSKKLSAYSALAGAFIALGATDADAGVIYTDVNPDSILGQIPSIYSLDLDNNGITDFDINFSFTMYSTPGIQYTLQGGAVEPSGNNRFMGTSGSYYAQALSFGAPIGAAQTWYGGSSFTYGLLGININSVSGTTTYTFATGNWLGETDKYLGLEFEIAGQTHYGWVRLDVKSDASTITIKDYAYEDVPNTPISAGDTGTPIVPADTAQSIMISDVADNGDGTDLEITFNRAVDENTVQAYRVIIVKTADAASFDVSAANNVAGANLTSITPTGSNVIQTLSAGTRDKDGDLISAGIAYRAFVLSVADGVNATANSLSNFSNELTLNIPMVPADTASNLIAADVSNNGNGTDLQISFDKAADETLIDTYRIIVVKSMDAATFNLSDAEAVTDFTPVLPDGTNISQTLDAAANDKDGDLISSGQPYKVFVLSMADGVNANVNQLSAESNEVILDNTIGIFDIGDYSVLPIIRGQRNQILVKLPQGIKVINDLEVFDAAGQSIKRIQSLYQDQAIRIDAVADGIYIVKIRIGSQIHSKKVLLSVNR